MRLVHAFVLLVAICLTACSSTTTGTSRQFDDASMASTGGIDSSTTGSGGRTSSGGSTGSAGGTTTFLDASSVGVTVSCPGSPSVTNVVETALPQTPQPPGAGGAPSVSIRDAGSDAPLRLPGLPTDPCVNYASQACPGGPRSIFGCPVVSGPSGSSTIHPGGQITVTVPMNDEGLGAYSCVGLSADHALSGGLDLFYAVKPAYDRVTGQLPPDTKPGTVIHFTGEASGSRYTTGPGTACSNDLTRIEFDVTVGG